jgi:hypothetical protein
LIGLDFFNRYISASLLSIFTGHDVSETCMESKLRTLTAKKQIELTQISGLQQSAAPAQASSCMPHATTDTDTAKAARMAREGKRIVCAISY